MKSTTVKSDTGWIGAGLLASVVASLCCITPVLSFMAGIGGIAATFSWLEPFRPYLIGSTLLVLGFAWYQKLKPARQEIDCECEDDLGKEKFLHTRTFLAIVTVVAAALLAFPSYSHIFYPETGSTALAQEDSTMVVQLEIEGMTCTGCEAPIKRAALKVPGVLQASASYESGTAEVRYDPSQTSPDAVRLAVNETGFRVTGKLLLQ